MRSVRTIILVSIQGARFDSCSMLTYCQVGSYQSKMDMQLATWFLNLLNKVYRFFNSKHIFLYDTFGSNA